ncbi:transcription factor IIIB 50 kDa subunit [Melanotaenia boesemani]|uniref:transcription factor IIIB 50 kDa subunit n=1 Tax=Melanotaenia boesemani TaxID=1250792 RepID=UPI001C040FCA|nr:transcription factor IIIB 50 kDa subunit [Melanotaenia boesemani]XP_041826892.1 transcription factor IIIB 50 kDa subunit [Melanotaenia boesemani]
MSRAGLSCPGCGSVSIVDDDLYCQAQLVCVDCGYVVSEGTLADDPVGGAVVSYIRTTAVEKRLCANMIKGRQRVREISQVLRVRSDIEELALTYYKQAYEHENFINVSLHMKEALAGCCVLVSCRQLNWPMTLGTISSLLNVDQTTVGRVHLEMIETLNIKTSSVSITDIIDSHCQEYKISSLHVPEELAEDSKELTKRAVALVELAADSWIVTGRKPLPIMMAAVYLAWQSLKPNKCRLKLSLDKFCKLAKVQRHKPAFERIAELKEVLCKLGKEIPWVREAVTPDTVVPLVGDILHNRYALLRRALRAHEDSLQADNQISCESTPTVGGISVCGDQTANASFVEQQHLGAGDGGSTQTVSNQSNTQSQDLAPNWGKRVLFAPPCVIRAKRRREEQPELDVNGDEEISDTEIDSYIRTPQEAREFALTQKMLSSSDTEH